MSKSEINLPKTAFSMKANLPTREPEILEYWKKINLYEELRNSSKGKEKFILHDGPPYANGNIHMGTALNKILKDIIVKFHQMDGKDSIYVPGWDCHGLPIEWKIEEQYKKNKKNKNEVPVVEFRKECRTFAEKWIEVHKSQFKRLGVVGDWDNYYSTMSFDAEAQIVRELGKFLKEGSLYRGFKPVLWSTVEKTALADAEVEYQDHKSDTIYSSFHIKSSKLKDLEGSEIIIWTTTPWTIPANKALAYNEALDYLILEIHDDGDFKNRRIVIAEALLESVIKECNLKNYKKINTFKGKEFKNTICSHPFLNIGYDHDIPMLEARFVTTEQGTGIVHCAPSHGPDDFNLCMNNGIKAIETVDGDGKYTSYVKLFEGIHIFKANPIVIEKLKEQKNLLSCGELVHSYPHSWRSKAPLVHRATPQWFISMESHKLRDRLVQEAQNNVGITFSENEGKDSFVVSGRGELMLEILLTQMRREGFEMTVSPPKVLYKTDEDGNKLEPIEEITMDLDEEHSSKVIDSMNRRKGKLIELKDTGTNKKRLIFHAPTRGLMGYTSRFLTLTKGNGVINRIFYNYGPFEGEMEGRRNGALISMEQGKAVAFAIFNLQARGEMFVTHNDAVYPGMIVGLSPKPGDMIINVMKGKKLTNMRTQGTDENVVLTPVRTMSIAEQLSILNTDEALEITPDSCRLRKAILDPHERKRSEKAIAAA